VNRHLDIPCSTVIHPDSRLSANVHMFKRDQSIEFLPYRDVSGTFTVWRISSRGNRFHAKGYTQSQYHALKRLQAETPVKLITQPGPLSCWMYRGGFYWEDRELNADDVKVLVDESRLKEQRRIERARARLNAAVLSQSERRPIPDEVKVLVWQRDSGRCVKCGSQTNLEFDHIIPLMRGGSSTFRNIQLLCAPCNREKGGDLI
jgi:hypothetical protein